MHKHGLKSYVTSRYKSQIKQNLNVECQGNLRVIEKNNVKIKICIFHIHCNCNAFVKSQMYCDTACNFVKLWSQLFSAAQPLLNPNVQTPVQSLISIHVLAGRTTELDASRCMDTNDHTINPSLRNKSLRARNKVTHVEILPELAQPVPRYAVIVMHRNQQRKKHRHFL